MRPLSVELDDPLSLAVLLIRSENTLWLLLDSSCGEWGEASVSFIQLNFWANDSKSNAEARQEELIYFYDNPERSTPPRRRKETQTKSFSYFSWNMRLILSFVCRLRRAIEGCQAKKCAKCEWIFPRNSQCYSTVCGVSCANVVCRCEWRRSRKRKRYARKVKMNFMRKMMKDRRWRASSQSVKYICSFFDTLRKGKLKLFFHINTKFLRK